MNIWLLLFYEFFKTGLFSVGGGLATLPFLFKMSENYGWFTAEKLTNMIAVSESTPGPIGVNIATYVGFTVNNHGFAGAVFTTLSLVLPSIIVILIIAGFLEKFRESKIVKTVFYGLRPAVIGLISVSSLALFAAAFGITGFSSFAETKIIIKICLFAVISFLVFKFKKHPIVYIAIGAVSGIVFSL